MIVQDRIAPETLPEVIFPGDDRHLTCRFPAITFPGGEEYTVMTHRDEALRRGLPRSPTRAMTSSIR